MKLNVPPAQRVGFLRIRERQCRMKATALWKAGWPYGEAMVHTWEGSMATLFELWTGWSDHGPAVSISGITETTGVTPHPISISNYVAGETPAGNGASRDSRRRLNEPQQQSTIPRGWLNANRQTLQAAWCCPDFQAGRCNATRPSLCPLGKVHRCSFICNDGLCCGGQTHGKNKCPIAPPRGNGNHCTRAARPGQQQQRLQQRGGQQPPRQPQPRYDDRGNDRRGGKANGRGNGH